MSAAAYETLEAWAVQARSLVGGLGRQTVTDDWTDRQLAYGLLLQRLRGIPERYLRAAPL